MLSGCISESRTSILCSEDIKLMTIALITLRKDSSSKITFDPNLMAKKLKKTDPVSCPNVPPPDIAPKSFSDSLGRVSTANDLFKTS